MAAKDPVAMDGASRKCPVCYAVVTATAPGPLACPDCNYFGWVVVAPPAPWWKGTR